MPEDPDGVWSTMDDHYDTRGRFDLSELSDLCAAYRLAANEAASFRTQAA